MSESKPRVVHVNKSKFDVYIGRKFAGFEASKWANPYTIGKDGTREEVIAKYEAYLKRTPELMAALPELDGKALGCWCKGINGTEDVLCHGDVLVRLLDEELVKKKAAESAPAVITSKDIEPSIKGHKPAAVIIDELAPKDILPVFVSHYSLGSSILTLEEAGKTKPGEPISICDIAKDNGLQQVILVEDQFDGYLEAYKNIQKVGIAQLVYGLRLVVCDDMNDKNEVTRRNESKVIVFIKNTQGYHDAIRLWNRAWTSGHLTVRDDAYGRIDWKTMKEFWTSNLSLSLPYFSSFIARNTLTMSSIVPDLPVPINEVTLFREVDSGLPFASLIDSALDQFIASNPGVQVQPVKTIYYTDSARDWETYVTWRAIHERAEFMRPDVPHLYSNKFSFSEWKRLTGGVS